MEFYLEADGSQLASLHEDDIAFIEFARSQGMTLVLWGLIRDAQPLLDQHGDNKCLVGQLRTSESHAREAFRQSMQQGTGLMLIETCRVNNGRTTFYRLSRVH